MYSGRKRKLFSKISIVALGMCFIFLAVLRCAVIIEGHYVEQLQTNLRDVAEADAVGMQIQIEDMYTLLKSMTARLKEHPNDGEDVLESFHTVVDTYDLKRVGYCDPEGNTISSDGVKANLYHRPFFKRGMAGDSYISGVLMDAMDASHPYITVVSMPVKNADNEVEAVSCMTFDAKEFSDSMAKTSFGGAGDTFIINKEGQVVVTSDEELIPFACNFFVDVLLKDDRNIDAIKKLKDEIRIKNAYASELYISNQKFYYYFTPTKLMDGNVVWFTFTIIPATYLDERFSPVKQNLQMMMLCVLVIWVSGLVVSRIMSVSQQKMAYELAYNSPITKGPNKVSFYDYMNKYRKTHGFLVYTSIQEFSYTSNAAGKENSDALLKRIWDAISTRLNEEEFACHDKADNFIIYMDTDSKDSLEERLLELQTVAKHEALALKIPWVILRYGIYSLKDNENIEEAFGKVQLATRGTHGVDVNFSYYDEDEHEKYIMNNELDNNFESAIQNREFEVWFQPKFTVEGKRLNGCEALVRWRNGEGKMISPGLFIPLLEKNGKIAKLDKYVFDRVCEKIREWKDQGYNTVPVSVNISRATLYRHGIVQSYIRILNEYGLEPSDIQLEVTESAVSGHANITGLLEMFRQFGIKILMDDFGTGLSSLASLNLRCFDTLKLDKSLIDFIGDSYGEKLLSNIIRMANDIDLSITAEGVEHADQLEFLKGTKIDDIQGYLFSRPLPAQDYEEILKGE